MNKRLTFFIGAATALFFGAVGLKVWAGGNFSYIDNPSSVVVEQLWDERLMPLEWSLSVEGYPGSSYSQGELVSELATAFDTWQLVNTSDIAFSYEGESGQHFARDDGVNLITFTDSDVEFPPGVVGLTFVYSFAQESTIDDTNNDLDGDGVPDIPNGVYPMGAIYGGDIIFNSSVDYSTSGLDGSLDFQSIALHEIGHFTGMSHSSIESAVMWPFLQENITDARSLGQDDIVYVSDYYPQEPDYTSEIGFISGSISNGSTGFPILGAHVYAADIDTGEKITGAYSGIDGEYRLPVYTGTYYVGIEPLDGDPDALDPARINDVVASTFDTYFQEELYDANESAVEVDPLFALPVTVVAGVTTENIDLVTNVSSVPGVTRVLEPGINYFAFPVDVPTGFTAFELLAVLGDDTEVTSIDRLNPESQLYERASYLNGAPAGIDFSISIGEGYLVHALVQKAVNFLGVPKCTPLSLVAGVNLVGVSCPPPNYRAYDLLSLVGNRDEVNSIKRYDFGSQNFVTVEYQNQDPVGDNFYIENGEAYLIDVNVDRQLIATPGRTAIFPPAITSISPGYGVEGDLVLIYGKGFSDQIHENSASFNGVGAHILYSSISTIAAIVPNGAASGPVVVTTAGRESNAIDFEVRNAQITENTAGETDILSGQIASGSLSDSNDQDRYEFMALTGAVATISAHGTSGAADLMIALEGPSGVVLVFDAGGSGSGAVIRNFKLPETGLYSIVVTSVSGQGEYDLQFNMLNIADSPKVSILSGGAQTAYIGTEMSDPFSVYVTGSSGRPMMGVPVTFTANNVDVVAGSQGFSLQNAGTVVVSTNRNGIATIEATAPAAEGVFDIVVTVPGMDPVTMQVSTISTQIHQVVLSSQVEDCGGDGCAVGSSISSPYSITYLDEFGFPISNIFTEWAVVSGEGSIGTLSPAGVGGRHLTDESGVARATHILGEKLFIELDGMDTGIKVPQVVAAVIPGRETPVLFSAISKSGDPASIESLLSNYIRTTYGFANLRAVALYVSDAFGNPVEDALIDIDDTPDTIHIVPGLLGGEFFPDYQTNENGIWVGALTLEDDVIPTRDEQGLGGFGNPDLEMPYEISLSESSAGSISFTLEVDLGPRAGNENAGERAFIGQELENPLVNRLYRYERRDEDSDGDVHDEDFTKLYAVEEPFPPTLVSVSRVDGFVPSDHGLQSATVDGLVETTLEGIIESVVEMGDVAGPINIVNQLLAPVTFTWSGGDEVTVDLDALYGPFSAELLAVPVELEAIISADQLSNIDWSTLDITFNGVTTVFSASDNNPPQLNSFPHFIRVFIDGAEQPVWPSEEILSAGGFSQLVILYQPLASDLQEGINTLSVVVDAENFEGVIESTEVAEEFYYDQDLNNRQWRVSSSFNAEADFVIGRTVMLSQMQGASPSASGTPLGSFKVFDIPLTDDSEVVVELLDRDKSPVRTLIGGSSSPWSAGAYNFVLLREDIPENIRPISGRPDLYIRVLTTTEVSEGTNITRTKIYSGELQDRVVGKMLGQTIVHDTLLHDGSLTLRREDLALSGAGPQLDFIRSYSNSRVPENDDTDLGPGWSHNHDIFVKVLSWEDTNPHYGENLPGWVSGTRQGIGPRLLTSDALTLLIASSGPQVPSRVSVSNGGMFERDGAGPWVGQRGNHGALSGNPQSGFEYISKDGTRYIFNTEADTAHRYRVARIEDRNGNALEYEYGEGLLARVTDQVGRYLEFHYTHTDNGRTGLSQVVGVVDENNPGMSIVLDFNYFRLNSSDPKEEANVFDEIGMLQSFTRDNFVEYYDYDAALQDSEPNLVQVEDANQHITQYQYVPEGEVPANFGIVVPGTPDTDLVQRVCYPAETVDCSENFALFEYVTDLENSRIVTDLRGNPTRYELNPWGNPSRIEEPEGKVTELDWTIDLGLPDNLLAEKRDVATGARWQYEYDAKGNKTLERDPYDRTVQQEWNQQFSVLELRIDKNGNRIRQELDSAGNVRREYTDAYVDGVQEVVEVMTVHTYGTASGVHGLRASTTDARSNTTYFHYDQYGNLNQIDEPEGSVTRYEHNARGLRTAFVDPGGNRTSYEYDNLDRLFLEVDGESNVIERSYDAKGNKVLEKTTDRYLIGNEEHVRTLQLDYTYDERDRVSLIERSGNVDDDYPLGGAKGFAYDGNSNIVAESDWKSVDTVYAYDGLNRRISTTNRLEDEKTIQYQWVVDAGLTKTITDYENVHKIEYYDLLGRLERIQHQTVNHSDNTQSDYDRVIGYDAYENITSILDEENKLTQFVYDPRYLKVARVNALNDSYVWEYDANGNLTKTIDEEQAESTFVYDMQNRLEEELKPEAHVWRYEYYPNGMLLSKTDPWGFEYNYSYDKINQRTSVTDPDGTTYESYTKDGELVYRRDAEGRTLQYIYGPDNRLQLAIDGRGRETEYAYDVNRNLTGKVLRWSDAETGPAEVKEHSEYDALDRVVRLYQAYESVNQRIVDYGYDRQGNLVSETKPEGREVSYEYDELYRVVKTIYPATSDNLATEVLTKYDGAGNLVWQQDRRGNTTQTQYDDLHRPEVITDALNQTIENRYDLVGNITEVIDKRGHTIETIYDELYRVTETYVNDNAGTRFRLSLNEYDINNNGSGVRINAVTDANNNRVSNQLDFRGNPTTITLPAAGDSSYPQGIVEHAYDNAGLLLSITDASGFTISYGYYDDGSLLSISNAETHETTYEYDIFGNEALVTKPEQNSQTSTYDERNRLVRVEDHHGNVTRFEYDVNSNLRHQYSPAADSSASTHVEYTYDALNRKRSHIQHKATGNLISSYVYDAEGNLTQINDANGNVFGKTYDALNRLDIENFPVDDDIISIGHTYDENSNVDVVTETKSSGIEISDYDYDLLDRLILHTQRGHAVSYAYDNNGNRLQVSSPGGTTNYTYDSRNRLATATASGVSIPTTYSYLQNGWKDVVTHSNGTSVDYDFYDDGQVQAITNLSGTSVISSFAYQYDENNNRTQQIETQNNFSSVQALTTDYVYDTLDRLERYTEASGDSTHNATHIFTYFPSYDRATEIVSINGVETKNRTFSYDESYWLNGIVETAGVGGSIGYAYDNNGNTLSKLDSTAPAPVSTRFSYNDRNQLKMVSTGVEGAEVSQGSYDYNYDGMRIRHIGSERGDIEYICDQNSIIDEVQNGTTTQVAHYRYGDRLLSLNDGSEEQFYHYAGLGTTTNLSDASGQVQVSYRTDPFGTITYQEGASVNRRVFTGHEHDEETGLIYMKARFYDPDVGRFLNQDTYLGENGTPPSLHRYLYAYSNPAYYIDPDGHFNVGGDPLTNEAAKKATEQIIVRTSGQAAATSFAAGASKFVPGVGILITVGTVGYQAHQLDQRLEAQAEANIRGTEAASEFQLPHERELLDKLRQREIFKRNNPNVLDAISGSGAHSDSVRYGAEQPTLTQEAPPLNGGSRVNEGAVTRGGESAVEIKSETSDSEEKRLARPGWQKGVPEAVLNKAPTNGLGERICEGCASVLEEEVTIETKIGPKTQRGWDIDHNPTWESRVDDWLGQEELPTREEVIEDSNDADKLRPLCPSCNRGHKFENKDGPYKGYNNGKPSEDI